VDITSLDCAVSDNEATVGTVVKGTEGVKVDDDRKTDVGNSETVVREDKVDGKLGVSVGVKNDSDGENKTIVDKSFPCVTDDTLRDTVGMTDETSGPNETDVENPVTVVKADVVAEMLVVTVKVDNDTDSDVLSIMDGTLRVPVGVDTGDEMIKVGNSVTAVKAFVVNGILGATVTDDTDGKNDVIVGNSIPDVMEGRTEVTL
jgi:hypothetical protein